MAQIMDYTGNRPAPAVLFPTPATDDGSYAVIPVIACLLSGYSGDRGHGLSVVRDPDRDATNNRNAIRILNQADLGCFVQRLKGHCAVSARQRANS